MQEENEILWRFYEDHLTHGRHHETLRASTSTVLLAIAAGILGLMGASHRWPLEVTYLSLAVFLMLLGIFGAFFTAKYHERFDFHMNRAREYRKALSARLPALKLEELRPCADARSKSKHPWLYDFRLHVFWVLLHCLIAALGFVVLILIVASAFMCQRPAL